MTSRNAYGKFSSYYDFLGWNRFAVDSAARIKLFLRFRDIKPSTALDFACGTGELEKQMAGSGIKFTGVDSSSEMLKVARVKNRKVKFVKDDVSTVRLKEKFDLVLFLFDSANHMNSLAHLTRVFKNARRHLKEDGYFIFDFLTENGLEQWEHLDIRRKREYTVITNGYYYPEDLSADIFIEAFVKKGKGYERIYQKIVERTYPPKDILHGLASAGFKKIMASSYDPDEELENASRLWFVCG